MSDSPQILMHRTSPLRRKAKFNSATPSDVQQSESSASSSKSPARSRPQRGIFSLRTSELVSSARSDIDSRTGSKPIVPLLALGTISSPGVPSSRSHFVPSTSATTTPLSSRGTAEHQPQPKVSPSPGRSTRGLSPAKSTRSMIDSVAARVRATRDAMMQQALATPSPRTVQRHPSVGAGERKRLETSATSSPHHHAHPPSSTETPTTEDSTEAVRRAAARRRTSVAPTSSRVPLRDNVTATARATTPRKEVTQQLSPTKVIEKRAQEENVNSPSTHQIIEQIQQQISHQLAVASQSMMGSSPTPAPLQPSLLPSGTTTPQTLTQHELAIRHAELDLTSSRTPPSLPPMPAPVMRVLEQSPNRPDLPPRPLTPSGSGSLLTRTGQIVAELEGMQRVSSLSPGQYGYSGPGDENDIAAQLSQIASKRRALSVERKQIASDRRALDEEADRVRLALGEQQRTLDAEAAQLAEYRQQLSDYAVRLATETESERLRIQEDLAQHHAEQTMLLQSRQLTMESEFAEARRLFELQMQTWETEKLSAQAEMSDRKRKLEEETQRFADDCAETDKENLEIQNLIADQRQTIEMFKMTTEAELNAARILLDEERTAFQMYAIAEKKKLEDLHHPEIAQDEIIKKTMEIKRLHSVIAAAESAQKASEKLAEEQRERIAVLEAENAMALDRLQRLENDLEMIREQDDNTLMREEFHRLQEEHIQLIQQLAESQITNRTLSQEITSKTQSLRTERAKLDAALQSQSSQSSLTSPPPPVTSSDRRTPVKEEIITSPSKSSNTTPQRPSAAYPPMTPRTPASTAPSQTLTEAETVAMASSDLTVVKDQLVKQSAEIARLQAALANAEASQRLSERALADSLAISMMTSGISEAIEAETAAELQKDLADMHMQNSLLQQQITSLEEAKQGLMLEVATKTQALRVAKSKLEAATAPPEPLISPRKRIALAVPSARKSLGGKDEPPRTPSKRDPSPMSRPSPAQQASSSKLSDLQNSYEKAVLLLAARENEIVGHEEELEEMRETVIKAQADTLKSVTEAAKLKLQIHDRDAIIKRLVLQKQTSDGSVPVPDVSTNVSPTTSAGTSSSEAQVKLEMLSSEYQLLVSQHESVVHQLDKCTQELLETKEALAHRTDEFELALQKIMVAEAKASKLEDQLNQVETSKVSLEANIKSLSADIVVRQQEAEVEAWRMRVDSLLRTNTQSDVPVDPLLAPSPLAKYLSPEGAYHLPRPGDMTTLVPGLVDPMLTKEMEQVRERVSMIREELAAINEAIAKPAGARDDGQTDLQLMLRMHELQEREEVDSAQLLELETKHATQVAASVNTRRAEELLQLRSEVNKLAAAREQADAETSLRVASLHEEKAQQHVTMDKMLTSLRKQLSASESQLQSLQRERDQQDKKQPQ